VPAEFAGQFSPGQSPLVFNDGSPVKNADDWQSAARKSSLTGISLMGAWPPVIEKPKIEVLETNTRWRRHFAARRCASRSLRARRAMAICFCLRGRESRIPLCLCRTTIPKRAPV
jgi:hypothetical protein